MSEKPRQARRLSLRDGPRHNASGDAGLLEVLEEGISILKGQSLTDTEAQKCDITGGHTGLMLRENDTVAAGDIQDAGDDGDEGSETGPATPPAAGEVASRLRPIYGFLSLKLGEKVMEVLQRCGRLRECSGNGCDIMATLEELIAQVEDIEALISALDGLMRDVDDEKIADPNHVRRYLAYCLHLRRRGRLDVTRDPGDAEDEDEEDGTPGECAGAGDGDGACRLHEGAPGGRCSCTGIERRKELARILGSVMKERGA